MKKQREIRSELPEGETLSMFSPYVPISKKMGLPFAVSDATQQNLRELGILAGYDLIPITDPGISKGIDVYKKRITDEREAILAARTATRGNFNCAPYLDCRTLEVDSILERCKCLYDNGFNVVNVVCGGLDYSRTIKTVGNYFKDKDTALIGTNVPKKIGRKNPFSGIHLYQTYGLTTIAPGMPPKFQPSGKQKDPHAAIPLHEINRFDKESHYFLKRGEHSFKHGEDLKCDCQVCIDSENLTGFYEKHMKMKGVTRLKSVVHEVISSIKELQYSNKFVGEMTDYFKTREATRKFLNIPSGKGLSSFF